VEQDRAAGSKAQTRARAEIPLPPNAFEPSRFRNAEFIASKSACARSPYLTSSCANASIVVGPWNFSVPELPKWIQPELKLFTISI